MQLRQCALLLMKNSDAESIYFLCAVTYPSGNTLFPAAKTEMGKDDARRLDVAGADGISDIGDEWRAG